MTSQRGHDPSASNCTAPDRKSRRSSPQTVGLPAERRGSAVKARIRGAAVIVHENRIALAFIPIGTETWNGGHRRVGELMARRRPYCSVPNAKPWKRPVCALWPNARSTPPSTTVHIATSVRLSYLSSAVWPWRHSRRSEGRQRDSEARFFNAESARNELILPEVFREIVWQDLADNFAEFRYLGLFEI